jgi:hypothetical protein
MTKSTKLPTTMIDIHDTGNLSIQTFNFHTLLQVENWDEAIDLIKKDPGLASQLGGSYKSYPLIIALMHKPPYELVKLLMKAFPRKLKWDYLAVVLGPLKLHLTLPS